MMSKILNITRCSISIIILIAIFNPRSLSVTGFSGNKSFHPLNAKVLSFAKINYGKKVGRGECVDLIFPPLIKHKAVWQGRNYGLRIATGDVSGHYLKKAVKIRPGDIIRFHNARLRVIKISNNLHLSRHHRLGYPMHVAVVEEVKSKYLIQILHQNVYKKRYVIREIINLGALNRGYYIIYRPYRLKK